MWWSARTVCFTSCGYRGICCNFWSWDYEAATIEALSFCGWLLAWFCACWMLCMLLLLSVGVYPNYALVGVLFFLFLTSF
jgi:hypothetical protein